MSKNKKTVFVPDYSLPKNIVESRILDMDAFFSELSIEERKLKHELMLLEHKLKANKRIQSNTTKYRNDLVEMLKHYNEKENQEPHPVKTI